ncbi:hemolysin [Anoxybacter fermentans]|uniref:Hemolysin n=1 Tax=Anoxybacter fermentans TaxID=1323375 RepID=A0A3Q9HQD5_9FIRM|nr:hemolysin family protein [Anoxybacter fermentans]AZR73152.1 hemolysin [Anoxybacter fermentans]
MKPIQFVELGFLGIFILLSGFFSGSETALMSLNKVKVRHDMLRGDERAAKVDKLIKSPVKLLTTILIGNNLVNIAGSALATTLALELFGIRGPWIATFGMTILVLVFGEITPKTFANQNSERVAYWSAPYLLFVSMFFNPLVNILIKITNITIRLLGGDPNKKQPFITEDEIIRFVNVGEKEGVIEEEEREMIHSIFEFDDTLVREVMVPRIDIIGVEENTPLAEAVDLIITKGHSRIPVFRKTIDNIVGVLYAKDLLKFVKEEFGNVTIKDLMRTAYFVPESKKVNQLLSELRNKRIHMAIVLDEYGGTAGIVTIEDLIEEIVGDIQDEYDVEDVDYHFISEKELVVDARMSVDELNDLLNLSLPAEDYDTLGGLVLSILGHVPVPGEVLEYDKLKITVKEMVGHRILKLHINILPFN